MAFSTTFFTPLRDFNQARTTPSPTFLPPIKSSFASSKSPFFQNGLSQQVSSNFPRIFVKPRSFSVHARAATEKTIYDFTVKVSSSISISIHSSSSCVVLELSSVFFLGKKILGQPWNLSFGGSKNCFFFVLVIC